VFGLEKADQWNPIRTSTMQSRPCSMRFLGFSTHENGAPKQEFSKWSMVCSKFSRRGCSFVQSASLAMGCTSKMRPPPQLHEVSTRNNKKSPRTLQMALVFCLRVDNYLHIRTLLGYLLLRMSYSITMWANTYPILIIFI